MPDGEVTTVLDYRLHMAKRPQNQMQLLSTAILERALLDYEKMGMLRRQAMSWINQEQDWIFSFREVCSHVGLDAEAVRMEMNSLGKPEHRRRLIRRNAGMSGQQRVLAPRRSKPR